MWILGVELRSSGFIASTLPAELSQQLHIILNACKNQENILFSSALGTSNSTISSFWWLLVFPMGIHDN